MFVLICSNAVISMLKERDPGYGKNSCFIVNCNICNCHRDAYECICPALAESLGIFLPLISCELSCFRTCRIFAAKNSDFINIRRNRYGFRIYIIADPPGSVRELWAPAQSFQ